MVSIEVRWRGRKHGRTSTPRCPPCPGMSVSVESSSLANMVTVELSSLRTTVSSLTNMVSVEPSSLTNMVSASRSST